MLLRLVPEALRDLAYRHENDVEEKVNERVLSTIASSTTPLWESESSTPAELPLMRTTAPWQLRTGTPNKIKRVYDGRFPKIFMGSLNNEPIKTKVKMTSVTMIGKAHLYLNVS